MIKFKLSEKDIQRFWSFVNKKGPNDCWLWEGGGPNNRYGHFSVGSRKGAKTLLAHRVSYFLVYGHTDLQVCHKCDITRCVNPAHLFEGTQKDNRVDCQEKLRTARGTNHGTHVLDETTVFTIAQLYRTGMSIPLIARELNRAETTVRHVAYGETWSWLTGIQQKRCNNV